MLTHIDRAAWIGVNPYHKWPLPAQATGVAGDPDTGYFWDDEEPEPMDWDEYQRERELYGREDY